MSVEPNNNYLRETIMEQSFTCHKCKQQKFTPKGSCGTGYAINEENNKICYECCGEIDKKEPVGKDRVRC